MPSDDFVLAGQIKDVQGNSDELNSRLGGNTKEYDNTDCTITGILKSSNGTVDTSASTYKSSDYLPIPSNAIKIIYSGVSQYRLSKWCGLVITDKNKNIIYYNPQTSNAAQSGEILLSGYPNAAYLRFCPYANTSASVKVVTPNGIVEDLSDLESYMNEKFDSIEECCEFVGISNDATVYGSYDTTIANPSAWGGTTEIATWKDDAVGSNGLIDKIYVLPMSAGRIKIAVGTLDQRGWMLSRYTFEVDVTTGWNIVDVTDKRYDIQSGEQLFVYVNYGARIGWKTTSSGKHLLYGMEDYELGDSKSYKMGFAYTCTTIDSIFALKDEQEAISSQIRNLSNQVASAGKLVDNNGNAYKLKVVNGELTITPLQYQKVVAIGNSLTANGLQTSVGWYGGDYAMAATSEPMGWTARLQTILRQKNADAVVNTINVAQWERSYSSYTDAQLTSLLSRITNDTECIIYRAGENASVKASNQNAYYNGLKRLVNKARALAPAADVFICGMMWENSYADAVHTQLANEIGATFVNISSDVSGNAEWLADYSWGSGNYAGNMYPIKNGAVAKHMNDVAFFHFANTFADILGYEKLTGIHNINISASVLYFINKNVGVSGGLISIHTYGDSEPTITVTSGGNTIPITIHDMSSVTIVTYNKQFVMPTYVITFEMPDSDVNVSIS